MTHEKSKGTIIIPKLIIFCHEIILNEIYIQFLIYLLLDFYISMVLLC